MDHRSEAAAPARKAEQVLERAGRGSYGMTMGHRAEIIAPLIAFATAFGAGGLAWNERNARTLLEDRRLKETAGED